MNSSQASSIAALGKMIKPKQLQTSSHSAASYCPSGEAKNLPAQKLSIMASESQQICQTSFTSTYVTLSNGQLLLKH